MSDKQNITSKRIENYSLWEFLLAFQEAVQQGYVLDLVSNENFPQQIGIIFTAGVVKQEELEKLEEEDSEDEPEGCEECNYGSEDCCSFSPVMPEDKPESVEIKKVSKKNKQDVSE